MGRRFGNSYDKVTMRDFSLGLNRKRNPAVLSPQELYIAENVVLNEEGSVTKRKGYSKFIATAGSLQINKACMYKDKFYGTQNNVLVYWNGTAWANAGAINNDFGHTIANEFLFVGDGTNVNKKWNGTAYTNMGIVAPTGTATVAVNPAAGNLNGSYTYKITFYRSGSYAHESNAGTASAAVTPANEKVDLTAIPVSTDTQVTARKIYRAKDGAGWYYIATISDNTTTTYTDNIADTAIGDELSIKNGVMPPVKYMAYAGDRIWGAGNSTDKSYVYYSSPSYNAQEGVESYYTGVDFIAVDVGDVSDEITGLVAYSNYVFVFKKNKIYVITAYDIAIQKIEENVGCIASNTIEVTPYGICFYSEQHFKMHDGERLHNISESIDPELRLSARMSLKSGFVAKYSPGDKQLWLSVPMDAAKSYNESVYVFFMDRYYTTPSGEKRFPISEYTIPIKTMTVVKDSAEVERMAFVGYIGLTQNYVYVHDTSNSDDGTAINMDWMTGFILGDNAGQSKIIRRVDLFVEVAEAETITVTIAPDFSLSGDSATGTLIGGSLWDVGLWDLAVWDATGTQGERLDFNTECSTFAVRINRNGTKAIKVIGFDVYYRKGSWR